MKKTILAVLAAILMFGLGAGAFAGMAPSGKAFKEAAGATRSGGKDDESPIIPELPPNPDPIIIPEPGDPSVTPPSEDPATMPVPGVWDRTFPAAAVKAISAVTESGPVTVTAGEGDVTVEVLGGDPDKCALTMELREGILLLKAESNRKRLFCPAGFKVRAPSMVDLKAKSGRGKVSVSGMAGVVEADLGMADISGEFCAKQLTVKGRGANVALKKLCGPAEIDIGGGSVAMEWAVVPASGTASVKTWGADISLVFPPEAAISASLKSDTGSVKNEFSEGGSFSVVARSKTGNIAVLKAK